MDPVTVGLAASVLLASKFGEGFAGKAGESTWAALGKLWKLVADKLAGNPEGTAALDSLAVQPQSTERQRAVAEKITAAVRADASFASEAADLVTLARRNPQAEILVATAFDSAKQVNIAGDNFGAITL